MCYKSSDFLAPYSFESKLSLGFFFTILFRGYSSIVTTELVVQSLQRLSFYSRLLAHELGTLLADVASTSQTAIQTRSKGLPSLTDDMHHPSTPMATSSVFRIKLGRRHLSTNKNSHLVTAFNSLLLSTDMDVPTSQLMYRYSTSNMEKTNTEHVSWLTMAQVPVTNRVQL